ncbi:helix-turn-helix transcriptional regulator [Brevibacillus borstelensis]|uniref:helix-turn-helix transcriptional regulator n=1 Tax=Brevibacillus borstelensis TaxID=45462 RepID=UPI001E34970B|nr:helix-turn-helix transcriptional regulator [Brevibacillus borstelensis]
MKVDHELVFRLRALERLTQEAFGKRIGVSGAMISDIERGLKSVSRTLALRIVAEFGLTPESEQRIRELPV